MRVQRAFSTIFLLKSTSSNELDCESESESDQLGDLAPRREDQARLLLTSTAGVDDFPLKI
jgi:HJR/Mrr/RecB family endonuclease